MVKNLDIYTDGAYSTSRDIGGWSIYCPQLNVKLCGTVQHTTNNIMELTAILKAVELLQEINCNIPTIIHSDSEWSIGAITNNWNIKKNAELVNKIKNIVSKIKVTFNKVKGHSNVDGNNIVDALAVLMTLNND